MGIFDYLLGAIDEIMALFSSALMKILGPLGAIATAIKSIFDWKRERERRKPTRDIFDDDDESRDRGGRRSNPGFWLIGRGLIFILLLSIGGYAWWKGSQKSPTDDHGDFDSNLPVTVFRTPSDLIKNYFGFIAAERYQDAWNLIDRSEQARSFPQGFEQFSFELNSRSKIQLLEARPIRSNNAGAVFSVQLTHLISTGERKNCRRLQCTVVQAASEKTWVLKTCDQPVHMACYR